MEVDVTPSPLAPSEYAVNSWAVIVELVALVRQARGERQVDGCVVSMPLSREEIIAALEQRIRELRADAEKHGWTVNVSIS